MRRLAYLLIGFGFLAGSLLAVQTPTNQVHWPLYLPLLCVGLAGTILARRTRRQAAYHAESLHLNTTRLRESLNRIVDNITRLDGQKDSLNPYEVHHQVDRLFRTDLDAFVEARESIVHRHGLRAYAAVMNEFAAGERYLNRVWSASVDGYVDEVRAYLARARAQFENTQKELRQLQG